MNTIFKTFSTIGIASLLAAGIYINSDTNESTTDNNSQQSIIIESVDQSTQIPFIDEVKTDVEPVSDLQGVKVVPKPEPVKPAVKPVVKEPVVKTPEKPTVKPTTEATAKPVVKSEPVKKEPKVETKVKKVKKEAVKQKPVAEPKPEGPKTDNVKAIDRAKETTKGYCDPELWVKWEPNAEGVIGYAQKSIVYWEDKSNPDIQTIKTMINPELDGYVDSSVHTAWHECAHAKTYSIPADKVDEIAKEIKKAFPESKYERIELLADVMATVKTGSTENNYYHKNITKEQTALAKKIWDLSPEITTDMEYSWDAYKTIDDIK